MKRLGREARVPAEVDVLEHVEHLDEGDAAGAGWRRGEDVVAAEGAVNGGADFRFISGEVGGGHEAALERCDECIGDGALVKGVGASAGDGFESASEVALD